MTSVRGDLPHFYNRIDEQRENFTADQFTAIVSDTWDVVYEDKVALIADAMHFTDSAQVEALANAFEAHFAEQ